MSQQPSSNTPKPALKAITPAHLIVSTIVTAGIAAGDAGFQYISTNGNTFSFTQLVGAVLVALFATLGTGVISLEKSPTVQQAIDGSLAPYVSALNSTLAQHSNLVQQAGQVVSYLIELAQHQAVVSAQPPARQAQQAAPVQQQPQPMVMPPKPQQIPAVNLANQSTLTGTATTQIPQQSFPLQPGFTRNFDTGLTPAVNQ